ncbi:MAG: pseudaminic acid synthase [Patescibacteria group bacterium]|nr:pseudaminic acid synthase [Patescibacteria group bacterium]
MKQEIKIGNRKIGKNHPVFIIAEISGNHFQEFNTAVKLIKKAKEAGVDAIKFQAYKPELITLDCDNKYFKIKQGTIWDGKTLYQLYEENYTPWEWMPKLKKLVEKEGLIFFSSVFDITSVNFLEKLNVSVYKIASFEVTDIPLIEYVAKKKKPIIISTGIATFSELKEVADTCRRAGNNQIIFLKCVSAYPTPLEEVNLMTIPLLSKDLKTIIGLSDHTLTASVPIAAVALGARVIEKHLILDRKSGGADAPFSLTPGEFKEMVDRVREAEKALGSASYRLSKNGKKNRKFARSLFVVKDMESGEEFTLKNVCSIRPGDGLSPRFLYEILGKQAKRSIKRGTPFSRDLIAK